MLRPRTCQPQGSNTTFPGERGKCPLRRLRPEQGRKGTTTHPPRGFRLAARRRRATFGFAIELPVQRRNRSAIFNGLPASAAALPFPPPFVYCAAQTDGTRGEYPRRRTPSSSRSRTAPIAAPPAASENCPSHEASQHRHHRPRRPRQDDARRPAAAAVGRLPRQPARRRAGDGFERSRARARHHHPRQGDLGRLEGHAHQHRRHARPRRFRRRGRAHPVDGRRRDRAGRRRRRADAADQVRRRQGAEDRAEADRLRQQGRQARRAAERGRQRGVRPVRRARRHRRAARLPDHLRLGQAGLDGGLARRPEGRHGAAVRSRAQARRAAEGRRRRLPHARHAARGQSLSRPHHHRPRLLRLDQDQRAGQGARPQRQSRRDRAASRRSSPSAASSARRSTRRTPATSSPSPASRSSTSPTRCAAPRRSSRCTRSRSIRRRCR